MGMFDGIVGPVAAGAGMFMAGASGGMLPALAAGGLSYAGGMRANEQNLQIAQADMNFQANESATAYQRAVADMKAAGLNPAMMYGGSGGAASTPGGALATMQNAMAPAVNTGMTAAVQTAQLDQIKAATDASSATAENQRAQAAVNAVTIPKIQADTQTSISSAKQLDSQALVNTQQYRVLMESVAKIAADTNLSKAQLQVAIQQAQLAFFQGQKVIADTGNVKADTLLKQLDTGRAYNDAKAQESDFMRYIAPYLPSVMKGTSAYRAVAP